MNFFFRIKMIIKFLFDKNIPLKEKLWIIIPLIYILSPFDLIPFPIFGFSLIDDLVVFIFTLHMVKEKTIKYYGDDIKENFKTKQDLRGKDIVEGVDYKVDNNEED